MRPQQMVWEFHRTFGAPIGSEPHIPDRATIQLRQDLIREEFMEFVTANLARDLVGVADALADLAYVVYGAALAYGIDLDAVIAEVHRSNMTKLGEDGEPIFRSDGKVLKGPNFEEPQIDAVLNLQRERASWQ